MLFQSQLYAQSGDSVFHDFSLTIQRASIWTERPSLQPFTRNHPWSVQLDWGMIHTKTRSWNYCQCYTRNGLSAGYTNFANPQQLGQAVTVSAFTEPVLAHTDRLRLSVRGSAGFAFLSKVYDSVTNKEPIFFSTPISFLLTMGVNLEYRLSEHFWITAAGQFNHISNGGRRDPNEGMNFIGTSLSLRYVMKPATLISRQKTKYTGRGPVMMVHGFGNIHTAQATPVFQAEHKWVAGVNAGLIQRLGRMTGLGAGGEYYYDGLNEVYQQRSHQPLQTGVGSVSLQHYLFLGKLLFGQQFAWYVTTQTGQAQPTYQRYFLEYEIRDNWYAGFSLKAHGDHSDYMAFSIGHSIKLR